jgi:hypothetical protein
MTTAQYTTEYIDFIKNTLVNQCITEFKRAVFEKEKQDTDEPTEYVDTLFTCMDDLLIWYTVFKKLEPIFNYYVELDYNQIQENISKPIFKTKTFQEYIDELVSMRTIGPADYQRFIQNMKNEDFRNKMIRNYEIYSQKNRLKNHLIFIVELHFLELIGRLIVDNENNTYVPVMVNAIPYFEYLTEKEWTIQDIENDSIYERSSNSGERTELKALKMIQQTMFV